MLRRLISCVLVVLFCLPSVSSIAADENLLTNFTVSCETYQQEQLEKLTDGDESTASVFTPLINTKIELNFDSNVSLSGLDVVLKTLPAWRNVRQLTIDYDGKATSVVDVNQGWYVTHRVMDKTEVSEIDKITISITKIDIDTAEYVDDVSGGIAEICVYGSSMANNDGSATSTLFEYGNEILLATSSGIAPGTQWYINNSFDGNDNTVTSINDVVNGYLVFQFTNPTDITEISLHPVVNSSWAVIKDFKLGVYNEEHIYRAKLKNPEPLFSDIYTLERIDEKQTFKLNDELFKGVTHLMIKFEDAYVISNIWGGTRAIDIKGVVHTEKPLTTEIIWKAIPTNTQIMCVSGLLEGEPDEIKYNTPTRMDGLELILKIWNEYDIASGYEGVYNFNDASLYPEYENILSYVYAYKKFGITGDENENFNPNAPLTAKSYYKMLLGALGYEYETDYTWENMKNLLWSLEMGNMLVVPDDEYNVINMCSATYEAITAKPKDNGTILIEKMHNEGRLNEEGWNLYADKFDRETEYTDTVYKIPENAKTHSDFSFTLYDDTKHLSPLSFAYNAPFHYAGIYYGTLPADDPRSKREEYAEALKKAGALSMRFPGGMPAHQYFIEGEEYSVQFHKDCYSHLYNPWSGLYDPNSDFKGYYVDFYNWLDFCNEYGIEPIFQTNTNFFVDENGKLRQAYLGAVMDTSNGKFEPMPGYYDHNRIDEAAQALARNIDELLEKGYMIKYWELGNEDFCYNYSSLPLSDPSNPFTIDFMAAVEAYVRVIKERIPDAYIMLPHGFDYKNTLNPEVLSMIGSVGYHYPFGRWSTPPDAEKGNPTYYVGMNELAVSSNNYTKEKRKADMAAGEPRKSVTETTLLRFQGWNSGHLNNMHAQALNVAHNYGDMVFNSGFDDAFVIHDLESTFFGYVIYDCLMNPNGRDFIWLPYTSTGLTVNKEDIPKQLWFEKSYYSNPASYAVEILSRHVNGNTLDPIETNVDRLVSAYSTIEGNKLKLTVVNRLNEEKNIQVKYPQYQIDEQTVKATIMQSDFLGASFIGEYDLYDEDMTVKGSDGTDYAVEFIAKPYSIVHLEFEIKN